MFQRLVLYISVVIKICPDNVVSRILYAPDKVGLILACCCGSIGHPGNVLSKLMRFKPILFKFEPVLLIVLSNQLLQNIIHLFCRKNYLLFLRVFQHIHIGQQPGFLFL